MRERHLQSNFRPHQGVKMAERSLLIVDDERNVLIALRLIFEGNFAVFTAESGSDALSLLREKAPDLTLLDIGLPDASGIDLLDQIKSLAPETAIIFMSAIEEPKMITKALELGALDYLVKPIDAKVLKTVIQNAFVKMESRPATLPSSPG
jgi:DNA-binding response OmpR family regulator